MVTEWQAACLATLKIDRWTLRQPSQDKLGVWIDPHTPVPLQPSAKRLLEAMLKAKGLSLNEVQFVVRQDQFTFYSKIWILDEDEQVSRGLGAEKAVLQTKSLSQLLAAPCDKKEVYEALQKWV